MIEIDTRRLYHFEAGLDTRFLEHSKIPAVLAGYGEISAIFRFPDDSSVVYKRLPLFRSFKEADNYDRMFKTYCSCLEQAGIRIPAHETRIIAVPGKPVCLYIAQQGFLKEAFCHRRIHEQDAETSLIMIRRIIQETHKVWDFNGRPGNPYCLAIDGQLSNWVTDMSGKDSRPWYIDTSTPLYQVQGKEEQNPELMLKSAPVFLRWLIRSFFLDQVMTRYYDPKLVAIDLVANLFKEQKPDLVDPVIKIVNDLLWTGAAHLTRKDVETYYHEDKRIWQLFLSFRKLDRFIATRLFQGRYDFILPGPIKR